MKVTVYCAYHNREHIEEIPLDVTCDTEDEVRIVVGTNRLKTCRVEKVYLRQWRAKE